MCNNSSVMSDIERVFLKSTYKYQHVICFVVYLLFFAFYQLQFINTNISTIFRQ